MAQISLSQSVDHAGAGLRVGRVLSRSLDTLSRHFLMFSLLTAIPSLPFLLVYLQQGGATTRPSDSLKMAGALMLLAIFLSPLIHAVVLNGAFQDMRGRPFGFGESLKKGLARFFPIIGLSICMIFAVAAGFLLLVIPGFILTMAFYVALPSCVIEKLGPIDSMRRSAALTKGHRWKIFGLVLLLGLISAVVMGVITGVFTVIGSPLALAIAKFLWQVAIGAFGAVVVAVVYHDLRVSREGIDIDKMAAVFD